VKPKSKDDIRRKDRPDLYFFAGIRLNLIEFHYLNEDMKVKTFEMSIAKRDIDARYSFCHDGDAYRSNERKDKSLSETTSRGLTLDINHDWEIVKKIFMGNFCYISQIGIFLPEARVMIQPTHNFEIFFFAQDPAKLCRQFSQIVEKHKKPQYGAI
jgi:hypothetical protein